MSILTAIIQAILQAVTWVLPISEYGHSSVFHDFSGRYSGACSALTGVIHIGIAIGMVAALYKLFIKLFTELFATFSDIFKKQLKDKQTSPARSFMYMTLLSFVPMLLWLIPTGNGFLYTVLRRTGFNATTLDDGVFFIVTGVLVFAAAQSLSLSKNSRSVNVLTAVLVGIASLFLVPVAGLSFTAGVFCALVLLGVTKKLAFRYGLVMSVPILIVSGIVEICVSVTPVGIVSTVISVIISAIVSFFMVKLLKWIVDKHYLKYFAIYDIGIGVITLVVGIFELALK